MNFEPYLRPAVVISSLLILVPLLAAAFFPTLPQVIARVLPRSIMLAGPALLSVPYLIVALSFGILQWRWIAVYTLLPVAVAIALHYAKLSDPNRRGCWLDYAVLAMLGLAVDLRWFQTAWPAGLSTLGKMLLLDAGIFGFLIVRQLDRVGFDLRLRWSDALAGFRELGLYALIAIPLGLGIGFLHFHSQWPAPLRSIAGFAFTFLFIAIPEELYFRGWLQNLLERRIGRTAALVATAILFGLAHWNKRTAGFNWRYVLMAAVAGVFYGRAWRAQRRVGASALTHASVDTLWSIWLR